MSLMDDQARLARIVSSADRSLKLWGPLQAHWAVIEELTAEGRETFSSNDIRERLFLSDGATYVWEVAGPYYSEIVPARACGLAMWWLVQKGIIEIAGTVENTQDGNHHRDLWTYRPGGGGLAAVEATDVAPATPAAPLEEDAEDDLFGDLLVGLEAPAPPGRRCW